MAHAARRNLLRRCAVMQMNKTVSEDNIVADYSNISVSILGATGSVGTQAASVASELGVRVGILSAGENWRELARLAEILSPRLLVIGNAENASYLREATGGKFEIAVGDDELEQAILSTKDDVIIHSIAGLAGLRFALAAAKTGARLAMANKEAIIAAGDLINSELALSGGSLIPVDSEHSAVFQCLACGGAQRPDSVREILLTASGGPFFGKSRKELESVTPEMALAHPTWKMGKKITIDSATLMNKGFEVIEACRLFNVKPDEVSVLVHRQSIVHSMVEYIDGSVIAQLGLPDMRSCIRYAVTYPDRAEVVSKRLKLAEIGSLTFELPDTDAFPLLSLAYEAIREDGAAPARLIAADEEAVAAFLSGRIGFCDISEVVRRTLEESENTAVKTAEEIEDAVLVARRKADAIISEFC